MPKSNLLRTLTPEEQQQLERMSGSTTEPLRRVEYAKTILMIAEGRKISEIAQASRLSVQGVLYRGRQFNEVGLEALNSERNAGRPETFDKGQREQMVRAANTNPIQLGLPFERWTIARLTEYLNSIGIPVSDTRLYEILLREGAGWTKRLTGSSKDSPHRS